MKIMFLGGQNSKKLSEWIEQQGDNVYYTEQKIGIQDIIRMDRDFLVSYNYRYILHKSVLNAVNGNAINLHISYLPYNRGAHPNLWSFLDETPKGVTIHYIDEGVDTGDIIVQKDVNVAIKGETLKSTYEKLHKEIQILFKENWDAIKMGMFVRKPQAAKGTIHRKADFEKIAAIIGEKGWNIQIEELMRKYKTMMI
jgi:methionyl-tRNA formyltransferase